MKSPVVKLVNSASFTYTCTRLDSVVDEAEGNVSCDDMLLAWVSQPRCEGSGNCHC